MKDVVGAIELWNFNSAALTGAWDEFVTNLDEACFLIRTINDSNTDVFISYNGINYHDFVPAGETLELSFQAINRYPAKKVFPRGQQVWLLGAAGVGNIYLAGYYSKL